MRIDISYLGTKNYWLSVKSNILRWKFLGAFLALYGLIWGILEPIFAFVPEEQQRPLKKIWWLYLISAITIAALKSLPRLRYKYIINGKDVILELRIGDFFSKKGDMIISTNSHFITKLDSDLISPRSIQGQFTQIYYTNISHLDSDLENALASGTPLPDSPERFGKTKEYKLGTTVKIDVTRKGKVRAAYFFAISRMNEHKVCNCSKEEFGEALGVLWNYLKEKGFQGNIIMPIIGSGFARVDLKREDLVRFIAKSFVAANADRKVCDKLSIIVFPKDINMFDMNIERVRTFLQLEINY